MSFCLAIDSSTKALSLALFNDLDFIEEMVKTPDGRGHAETLLPLIHELLTQHRLEVQDLQTIVVSIGPGSYTSLRVGIATVLGLSSGRPISLYGVSSLAAMAWESGVENKPVTPVLQAGRGKFYAATYQKSGEKLLTILPEGIYDPDFLSQRATRSTFPKARSIGEMALKGLGIPIHENNVALNYLQEPDLGI